MSWDHYSTLRGSGQKAELIGKLASRLASLSIRELRRVRSRLLRGVFIVKCVDFVKRLSNVVK